MPLRLETKHPDFGRIIREGQEPRVIADASDGLIFTEGPIWNGQNQSLTFSDIPGNAMYRWSEGGGLNRLVDYSYKGNGNAYAPDGDIVTCEHAASRIARRDGDGKNYRVVVSHYQGLELNSPNDVVVRRDGSIYFTDPYFGRNPSQVGVERSRQLAFCGVYRYAQGQLTLLDDRCETPNGLCFTGDERQLYVADSKPMEIFLYDVEPDGTLKNRRLFARTSGEGPGSPDGLKLDAEGNLYCCAQGGIHVFRPDGQMLGRICFPFQVANFTFGGKERKTLMICAGNRVLAIQGQIPGLPGPCDRA